jgi:hypothetical protein
MQQSCLFVCLFVRFRVNCVDGVLAWLDTQIKADQQLKNPCKSRDVRHKESGREGPQLAAGPARAQCSAGFDASVH